MSIFEGRVAATNEAGSLTLTSGQSAIAQAGQAPALRIVVRPRDAVQWALYYPPILDYRPADFPGGAPADWQAMVRKSIEFYWEGDLARAFSSLEGAPEDIPDPRFFTYRASLLLSGGRVDEAHVDIERALNLDSTNSHAFALQSIIAVVQNEKDRALDLARKAVELGPESSAARVALSYAQQAHFDLKGALASLQEAVKLDPENPLAWTRLADLWLSLGYLDRALKTAQKAVTLNSYLAHPQTVLGFAYLTQIKTRDAKRAFEKAIELDQAAPLPRLGLGLAKIRKGDLEAGRGEIEIAVSLDPNNALIRSYLGKAYFEEKRDKLALDEFAVAKELDPLDPTPWFYDAIRKQTLNRPVEALQDLQKSIELNDNRAIYRSRLLLDGDLAARSASLARIYSDLGFQQLALVEGWKSVNTDPDNYSAHRLLADLYSSLPRHEIARVSELLQSQLWQPINITPLQPQLAESNLLILGGGGPSDPSFNEFSPLFNRNRFALQANGVVGENDTLGDDLVHSGVWGRLSYSLGQFHYETDGFRDNNDLNENVYNVFVQGALSYKTSLQAEFRYLDREYGDLNLYFDRDAFVPDLRNEDEKHSVRFGLRHAFTPHSALIASAIYSNGESENVTEEWGLEIDGEAESYMGEIQQQFSWKRIRLVSGIGHVEQDTHAQEEITYPWGSEISTVEDDINHTNLYTSLLINYPKTVTWTIGGSADFFRSDLYEDEDQFNPKFGITWNPFPSTTARAAVFGVFTRTLASDQTIEPTQVAGFNQFFDDPTATKSWRYGVGIDQKFFRSLYGGVEFSKRDLEVPFEEVPPPSPGPPQPLETKILHTDWDEYLGRVYLYWTPHPWLAASGEFRYEKFEREMEVGSPGNVLELRTYWVSPAISFFHPCGLKMRVQASWVDQEGEFGDPFIGFQPDEDQFWVLDASIGYRLPKRFGLITVEGKNLLDEGFKFQDTDPANPRIVPERFILG
ncbi:MAG: tetratricopeptide repeat protein, partial [Deltaproteobacteria bacterium]|nr:tetratricopeptide repeat protein [Deltaproteobacteria bacterium]